MTEPLYPAINGDAVILTGGQSTRLGTDKALVRLGGETLLERMVKILGRIFSRVHLSIDPRRPYPWIGIPQIPDSHPGLGSLLLSRLFMVPFSAAYVAAPGFDADSCGSFKVPFQKLLYNAHSRQLLSYLRHRD